MDKSIKFKMVPDYDGWWKIYERISWFGLWDTWRYKMTICGKQQATDAIRRMKEDTTMYF